MTQELCKHNVQADVFHYKHRRGAERSCSDLFALLHCEKKDAALHCLCSTLMSTLIGCSFFFFFFFTTSRPDWVFSMLEIHFKSALQSWADCLTAIFRVITLNKFAKRMTASPQSGVGDQKLISNQMNELISCSVKSA